MKKQDWNNITENFHPQIWNIQLLIPGFWRPLRKISGYEISKINATTLFCTIYLRTGNSTGPNKQEPTRCAG